MSDSTGLMLSPQLLPNVFDSMENLDAMLTSIESRTRSETHDVRTDEGRKGIASLARKVSHAKTGMQSIGDPLAKEYREKWDNLNVFRRAMVDRLDSLRDEIKAPLTKWRAVETARQEALQLRLDDLNEVAVPVNNETAGSIAKTISRVEGLAIDDSWQELKDDADEAKTNVLTRLRTRYDSILTAEFRDAELEILRAEKLEREAQEAERELEARIAERERVAAENASRQAKIDTENALEREKEKGQREFEHAQREVAEANLRAEKAVTVERERAEKFEAEKYAAREKRERDDEHRAKVFAAVARALESDPVNLKPRDSQRVVGAVSDKLIPHLTINF